MTPEIVPYEQHQKTVNGWIKTSFWLMPRKPKKQLYRFKIWEDFVESRCIGTFEDENEDQAIEMAWNDRRSSEALSSRELWCENQEQVEEK